MSVLRWSIAHGQHIDPAVIGYVAQSRRGVVVHEIIARQVEKIAFIVHEARRIVGRAVNIGQLAGKAHILHIGRGVFPVVGDDLEIDLRILFMHQIVELGHIAVESVHRDDLMLAGGGIVITRVVASTAAKQRRRAAQR